MRYNIAIFLIIRSNEVTGFLNILLVDVNVVGSTLLYLSDVEYLHQVVIIIRQHLYFITDLYKKRKRLSSLF